jgi:hypothetical protein
LIVEQLVAALVVWVGHNQVPTKGSQHIQLVWFRNIDVPQPLTEAVLRSGREISSERIVSYSFHSFQLRFTHVPSWLEDWVEELH